MREGGLHTWTQVNMKILCAWDRHRLKWFRKASKENENLIRYMHPYVCRGIIYSS